MKITTQEQAENLPEVEFMSYKFGKEGFDGDEIILFVDRDGRSMKVVSTDKGKAKMWITIW